MGDFWPYEHICTDCLAGDPWIRRRSPRMAESCEIRGMCKAECLTHGQQATDLCPVLLAEVRSDLEGMQGCPSPFTCDSCQQKLAAALTRLRAAGG